ncbi:hypothetical protein BJF78_22465 [Pseudonocardia sp. CNS-139]|nr:hypothetical protein BJF78_22465 [Pseudonocardia sp. CNS-139]
MLLWLLALHVPGLAAFGLVLHHPPGVVLLVLVTPVVCVALGRLLRRHRRLASTIVTAGLVYCSAALVGLTAGSIESHFHFFIIIGFIALYQDWVPFLFNILFTVLSHGIGSAWQQSLIFNHPAAQNNPWLWSVIHGVAVLFACVGMTLFWRVTEEQQQQKETLARQIADLEIGRRQFTSDLLLNLARRNQSMLHRQLDIINQLEESERDPDALAELFKLDHLATRVRRNAESLLVLSGERPARVWSEAVPLRDVVRAAIGETEDFARVRFTVDENLFVTGHTVADLTHLLAELVENAVRFSPPDAPVTLQVRPDRARTGGQLVTIEDWGVGMPPEAMAVANTLLHDPPEADLAVAQRLGFHVAGRLAARHGITVTLSPTPGTGVTALVTLPPSLFEPRFPARPDSRPDSRPAPRDGAITALPQPRGRARPPVEDRPAAPADPALTALQPAVIDQRRPSGGDARWTLVGRARRRRAAPAGHDRGPRRRTRPRRNSRASPARSRSTPQRPASTRSASTRSASTR